MTITITSTTQIVDASGIKCRVWEGTTQSGVKVQCLIPRISALASEDLSEFERELKEQAAPQAVCAFPLRMVL